VALSPLTVILYYFSKSAGTSKQLAPLTNKLGSSVSGLKVTLNL
jgi:hypothetical protein